MHSWVQRPKAQSAYEASAGDAVLQLEALKTKESFRHLLLFLGVQVTSIFIVFLSGGDSPHRATPVGFTTYSLYIGVLLTSLMLHALAIAVYIGVYAYYKGHGVSWGSRRLPSIFVGCILVVDVGLFALARPDVHCAISDIIGWEPPCAHDDVACLSTLSHANISAVHCWVVYFLLLVLQFKDGIAVSLSCTIVYSVITLQATHDESSRYYSELVTMGVVIMTCLRARRLMELRDIKVAESTVDKFDLCERTVTEKVRRCEMEFQNERLQHRLDEFTRSIDCEGGSSHFDQNHWSSDFTLNIDDKGIVKPGAGIPSIAQMQRQLSAPCDHRPSKESLTSTVQSAPALLPSACIPPSSALMRDPGNCLPMYSRVWVESKAAFELVGRVSSGDRILCHDNLTGGLKYAPVMNSKIQGNNDPVSWVTVTLESGETLEVTADHPLVVWNAGTDETAEIEGGSKTPMHQHYQQGRHICAADLKIGQDCLTILKTVTIPVKNIQHKVKSAPVGLTQIQNDSSSDGQRVALVVHQPDRHSILVSFDPHGSKQHFTAVGSSGACPQAASRMVVKNTFIACGDSIVSDWRRTCSEPPMPGESNPDTIDLPLSQHAWQRRTPSPLWTPIDQLSVSTSTASSSASTVSSHEATIIRICGNLRLPETREEGEYPGLPNQSTVCLSELQQLHRNGLPSVGSSHCTEEDCQPCAFQAKKQRRGVKAKDCRNGAFCDFCHIDDHVQSRSAFRKLRRVGNMIGDAIKGRSAATGVEAARSSNLGAKEIGNKHCSKPPFTRAAPQLNIQGVPVNAPGTFLM